MVTLQFVREASSSHLLLLGVVEEGESARYTVNAAAFRDIGSPAIGDELDGEQMSVIRYTDELIRAKKKALSILSYADNNRKTLAMKLARAGFSRDIVDAVCSEMVERGYINEQRQLERLVADEANRKLRGPLRIIPALVAKGYSSAEIKQVLARLTESGEVNFAHNARLLLEKKLSDGAGEDEAKKILYKNGYKI